MKAIGWRVCRFPCVSNHICCCIMCACRWCHHVAHSPLQEENSCVLCKNIKDFSDMCQNSCGHIYCLSCLRGLSLVRLCPGRPVHSASWLIRLQAGASSVAAFRCSRCPQSSANPVDLDEGIIRRVGQYLSVCSCSIFDSIPVPSSLPRRR
jgi:hypothetical protein